MAHNLFSTSDKKIPSYDIRINPFEEIPQEIVGNICVLNRTPVLKQNFILNPAHNSHQSELSEFTQAFKKMLKMYVKSLNMSNDVIREFLNDYLKEDNNNNEDNEEEVNKVVLLIFEDNTIQPVLKVNDDLMNIIKGWYTKCDLILNIEDTELSIPKNILNKEKLHDILNTYVNYKDKEKYIQQYIPNEIIKTITKEIAEKLEKEIQVKKITTCEEKELPKPVVETTYMYKVPDNNVVINNDTKINDTKIIIPEFFKNKPIIDKNEKVELSLSLPFLDKNINTGPKAYNEDGNCLYKSAFDNCEKWNNYDIERDQKTEKEKKLDKIHILFNRKFVKTITVINPDNNTDYIINNCKEYGFVSILKYETSYTELVGLFEMKFDNVQFYSIDEINKLLNQLALNSESFSVKEELNNTMKFEENIIRKYVDTMYTITEDETNIVLCSSIYDSIIDKKIIALFNNNVEDTKKRIASYLKNLGFCKKLINNQAYYCKIVEKQLFVHQKMGIELGIRNPDEMRIFMNNLHKLRDAELREIFPLPNI
jgi:hypothetical protein